MISNVYLQSFTFKCERARFLLLILNAIICLKFTFHIHSFFMFIFICAVIYVYRLAYFTWRKYFSTYEYIISFCFVLTNVMMVIMMTHRLENSTIPINQFIIQASFPRISSLLCTIIYLLWVRSPLLVSTSYDYQNMVVCLAPTRVKWYIISARTCRVTFWLSFTLPISSFVTWSSVLSFRSIEIGLQNWDPYVLAYWRPTIPLPSF